MNIQSDSTEQALAESYDTTPYAGNPYYHTHPSVLAAYGILYGLSPSDPGHSRVLELGCGDGANIIPMAYEFLSSEFIGIDLSTVQIGIGQKTIDSLGLKNITLKTCSIMDISDADGKFDYIIAHGVYSWVSDSVREKILDICNKNLSVQGIAYISYNVLPGWQFNQSIRDLILYHTRKIKDPKQRTDAALDLINSLIEGTVDGNSVNDVQLRFFGKTLKQFPDLHSYLLHEYLETDNVPFYFHNFANDIRNYGLQYICDAEQSDFELDSLPEEVAAKFEKISENTIELEQYIDFLKNTRFRRSLVCHEDIEIDPGYNLEKVQQLFAATDIVPVLDSPDSSPNEATAFKTQAGRRFSTQHTLAQIILRKLIQIKPCTMDVTSLIDAVAKEAASESASDLQKQAEKIGHVIYSLFFNGVLELLGAKRQCVLNGGEFPRASKLAFLLASSGRITNLCHRTIVMDDHMACFVLALLDGTRNREALCDLMTEVFHSGQIKVPNLNNENVEETRESIRKQLESILQNLPRCGLLMA